MIFLKIEEARESFTKSEKKLVNYLEGNSHKIVDYNIMELAEKSGVSAPSIIRFSRKIGYNGFIDMRISLGKLSNRIGKLDEKSSSLIQFFRSSLMNTINFSNQKMIIDGADILKCSEKIAVFGGEGSEEIARDFYINLLNKNMNVVWDNSLEILEKLLKKFTEKDSVVIFSHLGENLDTIKIIRELSEKKVKIISITKAEKNLTGSLADINLCTDNAEKAFKINQIALSEAIIEQI
ncbi:MAG: MurR/RpiR family transcriptional regulator [Fusobacteriaceae bacterium]